MRYPTLLASLTALLSTTKAQSTRTTSSSKAIHTVIVGWGDGGHAFEPTSLNASVGDTVVYQFISKGHSVVKAEFGEPCIPYNTLNRGQPSFFSGIMIDGTDSQTPPTWNLTINSTDPVFYYCSKPGSCVNNKMIGVINPNSTFTLEAQQAAITPGTTIMLQPGEPLPEEGGAPPSKSHSLSTGAIVGIAIGGAVVILALILGLWYCRRRRRNAKSSTYAASSTQFSQAGSAHPTVTPWLDNQSTAYAPSSVGHQSYHQHQHHNSLGANSMVRPPSYMPGSPEPWEKQPLWSPQGGTGGYQERIMELGPGTPGAVEMDEGVRGRSRERGISQVFDGKVARESVHEKD